ncbi:hypothetical protein RR46_05200 [Papilio xuthus]|uniref:Secreted protein n=1 Tax=Papilio xuthus TaxID=66420 RepID=A0A194QEU8_PAPXU|nr:hypothetical protein RR46_05200 [Papilio xuthus]
MGGGQWIGGVLLAMACSVAADSWTAFQEQPCCRPVSHHRIRHHRDGSRMGSVRAAGDGEVKEGGDGSLQTGSACPRADVGLAMEGRWRGDVERRRASVNWTDRHAPQID